MRECACGRTKGLSDRPLETFGADSLKIGSGDCKLLKVTLFRLHFARQLTGRGGPEGSRDSERPENCPGDSFQRRMGGSPGSIGKPLARSAEREPPICFP